MRNSSRYSKEAAALIRRNLALQGKTTDWLATVTDVPVQRIEGHEPLQVPDLDRIATTLGADIQEFTP